MSNEQQQLRSAMIALEAQRDALGDLAVDAMLAGLRAKLEALVPATAPDTVQALKQVSILFLDVVGSTRLSQRLDPEAVSAVMDDVLARGTAIVQAHQGRVLQYAGDNILAVFGAGETREDDAERAVLCGLALLTLGKTLGDEVAMRHAFTGLGVRVGIHTGGVLLGGGVDAEGSIRGSAVNIAARMEQTAPAGGLRISHDTYAQVRGMFDVEAQPPLAVKGVEAPVASYLVQRAKPRQFRIGTRGIEGVATRMVGRDVEFEQLQQAFQRLLAERRFAMVTVVADAGIGKSRLLYEFQAWSEARPESFYLFRGRATPATGSHAYGLLRDIIAWRFQVNDDDSIDAARQKMEAAITPLFVDEHGPDLAQGHAHLLSHLIGIDCRDSPHVRGILDDPKQIRNRAFHAAAQIFRRVCESDGSTLILQLEDLHWADGESLDFLDYLAEVNRDVPMLVLAFGRPTLFERRADWGGTGTPHTRIDLQPLDRRASRELANELLQKMGAVPAALRELLTSSSEGNPFYMEELLKMLIDQGAIRTGERWSVDAERLLLTKVPPTLTGVLQARLDGLPAAEKHALQQASIVGPVFWDQALAAVEPEAAQQLPALVQRELTLPRTDAQLEGLREYAFRHHVLHQVTYDTVLKRSKREGHARVARWLAGLAEQGSVRGGDLLGLAAEHFEHADENDQAAEFHARAAEQAGQRLAHERVLLHVARALSLLGTESGSPRTQAALRWRLLAARESSLHLQGHRDEQAADLDALDHLAQLLDDDRKRGDVATRRAQRAVRMGDWALQEQAAKLGMAYATRTGDAASRLLAMRLLASARVNQGDAEGGQTLAREGVAEARRLGLRELEAKMLNVLAIAAQWRGDLMAGIELDRQFLQIHTELGNRVAQAIALVNQGFGWMSLGHLGQARQDLEAGLKLARANGDRVMEASALRIVSTLALWQGDETRALALARTGLDIAAATQAREIALLAGLALGDAELALGRLQAARQAYAEARHQALEIEDPAQHDASAGLARVALAEQDAAGALAAVQPLLAHIDGGGSLEGTVDTRLIEFSLHRVLSLNQDPRAATWLQRAHDALLSQAEAIPDAALRAGFLQNIPHHKAIAVAWTGQSTAEAIAGEHSRPSA